MGHSGRLPDLRRSRQPARRSSSRSVCESSPRWASDSAVFFTSGGSDSVDTAAKIARRYWVAAGEPQRQIIICRQGAYHGVHAFGTSLSGIELNAAGWGPLVTQVVQVGRDDLPRASSGSLERTRRRSVAAFIGEPVQGAAGVHPPARGLLGGRPGPLPQPRRAGDRRRGRDRLRPSRSLVRQRALRHRARPDPLRQGAQLRLPACRRRDRRRPSARGPVVGARLERSATATPTPGTRPAALSPSPTSRSSSTRACSSA